MNWKGKNLSLFKLAATLFDKGLWLNNVSLKEFKNKNVVTIYLKDNKAVDFLIYAVPFVLKLSHDFMDFMKHHLMHSLTE